MEEVAQKFITYMEKLKMVIIFHDNLEIKLIYFIV
jgi:hypothetical protein